jgi:hypothetical protein
MTKIPLRLGKKVFHAMHVYIYWNTTFQLFASTKGTALSAPYTCYYAQLYQGLPTTPQSRSSPARCDDPKQKKQSVRQEAQQQIGTTVVAFFERW